MKLHLKYFFILLLASSLDLASQNEHSKWYFGNQAGLDFMTNPPTVLTNGVMNQWEGCASMADASGGLQFYTDGITVWNKLHTPMANGTGLFSNSSVTQAALIVKQPGSNTIYHIFHLNGTLYNSTVDMSLSAGNGSVTSKNVAISPAGMSEKLTGVRDCLGNYWIIVVSTAQPSTFRAYYLSPAGVNLTPVISVTGPNIGGTGTLKSSPNGRLLANSRNGGGSAGHWDLLQFDPATGIVNHLYAIVSGYMTYGCEFSPDGSKLYVAAYSPNNAMLQYDLCNATSSVAVASSMYSVACTGLLASMQMAPNGKVYCVRDNNATMAVIDNPNVGGAGCNFVNMATVLTPKTGRLGLPNFIPMAPHPVPPPFTFTVSNVYGCQTASFTPPFIASTFTNFACTSAGYSLTGMTWIFGDPASGASNTTTAQSPAHAFSNLGTYTVKLILNYSCGGGTDTLQQVVNINQPCITVNSTSITCANLGSATVQATGGIGPYSYTWFPTNQNSAVATGLSPGTYTIKVWDMGNNFTYTATTQFTSLIPLTGNVNHAASVTCNGASTASANVTNIAGGSGTVSYVWMSQVGGLVYTSPTPSLSAGIWSVTVTDALSNCQIKQTFLVTQPPALNITMNPSSATICVGKPTVVSGAVSGGTPKQTGTGYTYQWSGGPTTYSRSVTQGVPALYTYSLTARDSLQCEITGTVDVDVIPGPVLSVSNVSICPLATGTLTASGASTYTWSNGTYTTFMTDAPSVTTQYTVTGASFGCTTSAVASMIIKPTPFAVMNHNAPICEGKNLNLQGLGGISYLWSGPLGFTSTAVNPVISAAYPAQSGIYEVTVTAANACTATALKTVSIHPTPTISIAGSTVCTNQSLLLNASSSPGATFSWKGPVSFTSSLQNPVIALPGTNRTGNYTVQVVSTEGCIGTAVAHASVTALPTPTISSNSPKCFGTNLNLSGTGGETYSWTGPNGFTSIVQNPFITGVTLAADGVYNLQIMLGPCTNTASTTVTIFPLPSFTMQSNSPVCETKTLNLNSQYVSNATSYTWFGPGGFVKLAQNITRPQSLLVYSGDYTLTVKDQNNCQNSHTIAVVINPNPVLTTFGAKVCLNAPATLSVAGASTYQWSGPDFYQSVSPDAFIPSAVNAAPTTYTVVGTAANGCTSIATAGLETLPLPQPFIHAYPSQRMCAGRSFTLQGNGGVYYVWKGPGNLVHNERDLSLMASTSLFSGVYSVTAIDANHCGAMSTIKIEVDPLPGGGLLGSKMKHCVPFESEFYYNGVNDEPVLTKWLLNGSEVSEKKSFSRKFTVPGDYVITGILTNTNTGCVNTKTYVVSAYPVPVADFTFTPQRPVEGLDEVQLINRTTGEDQNNWRWFLVNDEGPKLEGEHKAYLFEQTGLYPVALVVENKWGCSDTMIKAIRIEPDFNIFVPNAFTPNGDGINETFLPVMTGVKFYNIKIFNRWGTKIFETSDPSLGWPGEYNDTPCKSDVYTWKISVSSHSGEMKTMTGSVYLSR